MAKQKKIKVTLVRSPIGAQPKHRDTALAHGAEQAPAYPVLSAAIKAGSRLAIWLSERV